MATITVINALLLFAAALILVGILSSLVASRFGAPLLLVFLVVGMLVGEDGPGGVQFSDYRLTYLVGSIALAIILFDGGLRTRLASFRGVLAPSAVLATLGVVITAAITGAVAMWLLDLDLLDGFLVGAMVASTDAAAVFFLLRTGGLQLRSRVNLTLEIESGTNDPVAVFVTLMLVGLVTAAGHQQGVDSLVMLLQQAVNGTVAGLAGGFLMTAFLNRLDLPAGLHPLFAVAGAILIFALTALVEGSGFLAVYVAGLVVGNRRVRAAASIAAFHDTVTWLCQIAMFLVLGLLVTPSRLVPYLLPAIGIAAVLMLVARPVAVALCLAPFGYSRREVTFIAWVGLRGAVSIFLAAIPTLANVPSAETYFNVVFVVVIASLVVQGWTIKPLAWRLGLALPRVNQPVHRVEIDLPGQLTHEMVGYPVTPDSPALEPTTVPAWARPVFVVRDDGIRDPLTAGRLRPGDYAYFLAPPDRVKDLDRLFARAGPELSGPRATMLPIAADTPLTAVSALYGLDLSTLELEESEQGPPATVAELFGRAFEGRPDIGDRLDFGPLSLIVRGAREGTVTEAAILLLDKDEPSDVDALIESATAPDRARRHGRIERHIIKPAIALQRRLSRLLTRKKIDPPPPSDGRAP